MNSPQIRSPHGLSPKKGCLKKCRVESDLHSAPPQFNLLYPCDVTQFGHEPSHPGASPLWNLR
jgi:hypothetical protein